MEMPPGRPGRARPSRSGPSALPRQTSQGYVRVMASRAQGLLQELSDHDCWALLAEQGVGRLAVARGQESPLVVPVNYVVVERTIRFRTGFGALMPTIVATPVSFQVDDIEPSTRTGWCVLVDGRAHEVSGRDPGRNAPEPWVVGEKPYLIELAVRRITGRRVVQDTSATSVQPRPPTSLQTADDRRRRQDVTGLANPER